MNYRILLPIIVSIVLFSCGGNKQDEKQEAKLKRSVSDKVPVDTAYTFTNDVDSLKIVAFQTIEDTNKTNAQVKLAQKILYEDVDSGLFILNDAERIAKTFPTKIRTRHLADIHVAKGVGYKLKGNFDSAEYYYLSSLKYLEELNDKRGAATVINNLANLHYMKGDYPNAISMHLKALKIREEIKDTLGIAMSCGNIGLIYNKQKDNKEALRYYNKGAEYFRAINNQKGEAWSYSNIGTIHLDFDNLSDAFIYLNKSISIYRSINDLRGVSVNSSNISLVFLKLSEHPSDSLKNFNITTLEAALDSAKKHADFSFNYQNNNEDEWGLSNSYSVLGEIERLKKNYTQAINHYQKGLVLAKKTDAKKEMKDAYLGLTLTHEMTGHYIESLKYFKLYTAIKDTLFNEDKSKEIGKVEAQFEFEKQQKKAEQIKNEEIRKEKERKRRRDNLQYSIILIAILTVFGLVLSLGFISISQNLAEGLIFFAFLLLFEFLLVLTDPYVDNWTGGEPMYTLLLNAVLAGLIFPAHSFFERKLKIKLLKNQRATS